CRANGLPPLTVLIVRDQDGLPGGKVDRRRGCPRRPGERVPASLAGEPSADRGATGGCLPGPLAGGRRRLARHGGLHRPSPAQGRRKIGARPVATTKESREGPTPNGGVRSEAYYSNDQGEPVDKSVATCIEIVEYDAEGKVVGRTYGTLTPQPTK